MDEQELDELLDWLLDPRIVASERLRAAIRARAREWRARRREPIALPRRSATRVVLGIDVSASHGLDLVVLGDDLRPARIANVGVSELARFIRDVAPDAIGIDSPPSWARSGKSRAAERQLAHLGVSAYAVPADGLQTAFHQWMRVGFDAFAAAEVAGYPRWGRGPFVRTALEVFPYGSAVALAGYRPKLGTGRERHDWRRSVLRQEGVDVAMLRTADHVDAALAALTALHALGDRGTGVGDPDEGIIVLPVQEIPAGGWPLRAA